MQRKKKEKKKQNNYFDINTEKAIVRFQKEPDIDEKKKIFVEHVRPAFIKLVENIIFVYKFHSLGNIDVLKNDCVSFLFESLYKFDETRGHKAFSYFNVVAKNWFIQRVKVYRKKNRSDVPFDKNTVAMLERNNHEAATISYEDLALRREFVLLLKEEIKKWREKFDKPQERKVLEAIILLLDNPELISIYNKKAIYLYLREIVGINTKQIVTNLSKFKKKYNLFKKKYLAGEI